MATLILLNGTSSSGKSTIARAFQELAPSAFLNFSIDSILYTLPPAMLRRLARGEPDPALDYPALDAAFFGCVRELLSRGLDLVIDNAITRPEQVEQLAAATAGHRAITVGLTCDAETLVAREAARGDRRPGIALRQLEKIHALLRYDLMLDSAALSPEAAAARIVGLLTQCGAADPAASW